jgi:tetratricopeptide (TPR) repeat protein
VEQARLVDTPSSGEVTRLKRLYERNPTSTIFARLGDAYLSLGEAESAIQVCRQGLRYRPSYITGHLVLARSFSAAGNLAGAEDEFQKVLRLEPDNPAAVRYLASIAERSGDSERAEQFWERLRILDPYNDAIPAGTGAAPELPSAEPIVSPSEPVPPEAVADEDLDVPAGGAETRSKEFPFVTLTLAKLYASQGHKGRAERVARLIDPAQADSLLGQLNEEAAN